MKAITILIASVFVVLVGCSSGGSDGATSGGEAPFDVPGTAVDTTEVELPRSYRFDPAVIAVASGSTVTWTNHDDFPHNVHLLDGSDVQKDLPIGGSASIEFDEAGTVYYECSIHPQMHGKIEVG